MRSIWFFGCLVRDLSPQAGAGSGYALLEITAPPGSQPPPHIHHREDEGFYVLEGEMSVFTAAGGTTPRPGDHLTGPRGVAHTGRAGPGGVRKLVISAPGGFADFVREVGVPAARDELPPPEGPPDVGGHDGGGGPPGHRVRWPAGSAPVNRPPAAGV